jgi:hypothetical protein
MFKFLMIPFEMLTVEKCFKRNGELSDWNFVNDKKEFGKQSSPVQQFSNCRHFEKTDDSSKKERALLHFLKDVLLKNERKHLLK